MSIRSEVVRIFNELLAGSKKISELPDASTPLAGTEQVELNQGGVSVKTAVSNIGGGGGGAVSSVNGQTGAVVLDLQDVMDEGATASVAGPVSIGNSTADDTTLDAGSRLVLKTNGGTEQLTIGADGGWYLSGSDPGTSGQVIKSNGAAPPTWENAAVAPKVVQIACSDEVTPLTTGTKATFRMPYAMTVSAVRASLTTAQASGSIFTVDIKEAGTTILSTLITIDNTEKTSTTAATAPVISDTALADDAEITILITQIGNGSAVGLKVAIIGS